MYPTTRLLPILGGQTDVRGFAHCRARHHGVDHMLCALPSECADIDFILLCYLEVGYTRLYTRADHAVLLIITPRRATFTHSFVVGDIISTTTNIFRPVRLRIGLDPNQRGVMLCLHHASSPIQAKLQFFDGNKVIKKWRYGALDSIFGL